MENIFNDFFYGRAYCFALRYAGFLMLLLGTHQEVTKKCAKTFPLGTPFPCRATNKNKRDHISFFHAVLQV